MAASKSAKMKTICIWQMTNTQRVGQHCRGFVNGPNSEEILSAQRNVFRASALKRVSLLNSKSIKRKNCIFSSHKKKLFIMSNQYDMTAIVLSNFIMARNAWRPAKVSGVLEKSQESSCFWVTVKKLFSYEEKINFHYNLGLLISGL